MPQGSIVIVCGLAGALVSDLLPGTILVPDQVGLVDGRNMLCDPVLVQMLATAAHALRFRLDTRPLLTTQSLVVGNDRFHWAQQGFAAVDMETGFFVGENVRVATLRVVLDCPERDISSNWLRPMRGFLQPSCWRELFWLGRVAPQYALRAARVLKVGFGSETGSLSIKQ